MLVNAHWLKKNIKKKNIKILDASWYLPNINRNPKKEFTKKEYQKQLFLILMIFVIKNLIFLICFQVKAYLKKRYLI